MGISFQELILLLMIGLIVLGPERLPRVANQLGSWLGQARRMTRVMKRQLEEELNLDRQFDMLPPARTRHSTPGTYKPPTPAAADSDASPSTADPDADPDAASTAAAGDDAEPEKDDTYSPAHGSDEVGTGVGDEATGDKADDTADATTDQPPSAADDRPDADQPADDSKKESA